MIKKLLVVVAVLISVPSWAMSFEQSEKIYYKIAQSNGIFPTPRLVYDSDPSVNAGYGGSHIEVNAGLLRFVGGDSNQLALVLAHELAHYKLGHGRSTPSREFSADNLGARYMQRAGYNKCAGARFLKRLNTPDASTHPSSYKRVKALGCSW